MRQGKLRGFGVANPIEVAGGPYTAVNPDTSVLRVNPDGSVTLFTGSTSMGQGNETAFTQIVSDRLGVPPSPIKVLAGDRDAPDTRPRDGGRGAPPAVATAGQVRSVSAARRWRGRWTGLSSAAVSSSRIFSRPLWTTSSSARAGGASPGPIGA